jgi:DNA polymerase III sliding clamp (beta) subunit (PCNA family)
MDAIKYCELATSKDKTRINLNGVYRAEESYVATDGHRLHMSNGLNKAEPHYLTPLPSPHENSQFPDYTQVLPDGTENIIATIKMTSFTGYKEVKKNLQTMKRLATLLKPYDRQMVVRLEIRGNEAWIVAAKSGLKFELKLCAEANLEAEQFEPRGINLMYLHDALLMCESEECTINFQESDLAPIDFVGSEHKRAIVTPCRLK